MGTNNNQIIVAAEKMAGAAIAMSAAAVTATVTSTKS
jgi:hypothetical protein